MTNLLICVNIVVLLMLHAVVVMTYLNVARNDRERKAEEQVQAAMDEASEADARRSREMDEGFDNLMGYTVNLGRGRSTGGEM